MEYVTLNNGVKMPQMGFGVFQITDAAECEQAVANALEAGYRMIDTASAYANEEAVGAAIRKSGIRREELFITTKLWIQDAGYESTKQAFQTSLDKLGLDYLDLYLIHQPFGDYYGSWRAMEELYKDGKIRAIGVCNFYPDRLTDLCLNAQVIPAVDQVELHPFFPQTAAIDNMKTYGVQPEAWRPLAQGAGGIFENPELKAIADKYGKTVAQVVLRWNIQRGVAVIPKSTHKERMVENMDVWNFALSAEDMEQISKLDQGESLVLDHYSADTVRRLNGLKIHD
ncbi:MAG: aldo/keto reductase [Eubacteriales bacterium]|nr:aldo/keto reductase [Eubacteriales bacterium]